MPLGKSSFVISIPKSWLMTHDLDRGDSVSLDLVLPPLVSLV